MHSSLNRLRLPSQDSRIWEGEPLVRLRPAAGPSVDAALGRDHQAVGIWRERLPNLALVDLGTISLGRVDQVDPEFHRAPQDGKGVGRIRRLPVNVRPDEVHRTEAEPTDRKIASDAKHRWMLPRVSHAPSGVAFICAVSTNSAASSACAWSCATDDRSTTSAMN